MMRNNALVLAELIDAFRIVPRAMLVAYGGLTWHVISWYMLLPAPTTQQAALVTTVTGLVAAIIGLYQNSGFDWKNKKEE